MKLSLIALAALSIGVSASAQPADLRIVSLTTNKSAVSTGERFSATLRWRNDGPGAANDVVVLLESRQELFVISGAGTSNWPCQPTFGGAAFSCRGVLPAGGEAHMVVSFIAPPSSEDGLVLSGRIGSFSATDPTPANNRVESVLVLTPSPATADLSLSPLEQSHFVDAGGDVMIPITVRNRGPSTASDLAVMFSFEPELLIPVTADGAGWSCTNATHSPQLVFCLRDSLAADSTASLVFRAQAPNEDGRYEFYARVTAQRYFDPLRVNHLAEGIVQVGIPAGWKRMLVPLTGGDVPGQNGSLWRTETTGLLDSVTVAPYSCVDLPGPCSVPTQRRPFDWRNGGIVGGYSAHGQFVYFHEEHQAKVRVNSRVYDVSRQIETAGSEIPIAREEDFSSTTVSLLGIPVAAQYRHTLRVYDFDAVDGARIAIRIYADGESSPRASVVERLTLTNAEKTGFGLPITPATLQLDPATLLSLAGIEKLRIDVEPLDGGHIWAFVSLTNNDTHHVTTFSAQ